MDEKRLAEIKARADAATEGPWYTEIISISSVSAIRLSDLNKVGELMMVDANFLAHAHTDVPDLIAEVERLRAIIDNEPRLDVDHGWIP